VAIALLVVWIGLALAYFTPYPVGFYVTSLGAVAYGLARLQALRSRA
jgi:zinc/manganese transport system permease protein